VELADGREVMAKPRGRLEIVQARAEKDWLKEDKLVFAHHVSVGDQVVLSEPEAGQPVIEELKPRETWLLRRSGGRYRRRPQCVVANADQLAVVVAPNPEVRLNVVDRYFLAAIQGGLEPMLVVNKIDLDPKLPESLQLTAYRDQGYGVFFTAALNGQGLPQLAERLAGKLTAFCGHSGVGKSTILSALTGVKLKTLEVRPDTLKGRQATETSRIYHLPGGGLVVDTPGVREFGLIHLTWLDVHEYFADIATLAQECAYRDCTHTVEPECAVQRAVKAGQLAAARLLSFQKLRKESEVGKYEL